MLRAELLHPSWQLPKHLLEEPAARIPNSKFGGKIKFHHPLNTASPHDQLQTLDTM